MKAIFKNGLTIETTEYPDSCNFITFTKEDKKHTIYSAFFSDEEKAISSIFDLVENLELETIDTEEYGIEYAIPFGDISILIGEDTDYIRVVRSNCLNLEELGYWIATELVEEPKEVLGALIGLVFSHVDNKKFVSQITS